MVYCRDETELSRLGLQIDPRLPHRLSPIGLAAAKGRSFGTADHARVELDREANSSPVTTLPRHVLAPARRPGSLGCLRGLLRAIGTAVAASLRLAGALLEFLVAATECFLAAGTLGLRKYSSRMSRRCQRRRPRRSRRRKS